MSDKITSDVVILSEAYGMHIKALGKYWALASTVTVLALTADTSLATLEIFGFKFNTAYFYPACAIFGAILNFAYCISHLQAYRAGEIFRGLLRTVSAEKGSFGDDSSVLDASHLLYPSAINRVFPLSHFLPTSLSDRFVQLLKLPVDLFVFIVPASGCLYASTRLNQGWGSTAILILVAVSLFVSVVLIFTGVKWVFTKHGSN